MGLSAEEVGAYTMLLIALWSNNGNPLPLDQASMTRIMHVAPPRYKRVWARIEHYFLIEDGCITNQRLSEEYTEAVHLSQVYAGNGSKGGKAKAANAARRAAQVPDQV